MPARGRPPAAVFIAVLAAAAPLVLAAGARTEEDAGKRCRGARDVAYEVAGVRDAVTLTLTNGKEVRLDGLVAPEPPAGIEPEAWLPASEAKRALSDLVTGKTVELSFGKPEVDRYGRLLAEAWVRSSPEPQWIEKVMIAGGHARAGAPFATRPCSSADLHELLAEEDSARHDGRGLWSHAAYSPLAAGDVEKLMRTRSDFVLVEGRVAKTAERSRSLYLDFGENWRTDFTVVVPTSLTAASPGSAGRLLALQGERVRVRGWIERHNGPSIEIRDLAEIERIPSPDSAPAKEKAPQP